MTQHVYFHCSINYFYIEFLLFRFSIVIVMRSKILFYIKTASNLFLHLYFELYSNVLGNIHCSTFKFRFQLLVWLNVLYMSNPNDRTSLSVISFIVASKESLATKRNT